MKKYYKVVRDDLTSLCVDNEYKIQYSIEEWTEAKIGKIFVFDDLGTAQIFAGNKYRIFECEARNAKKYNGQILKVLFPAGLEIFWEHYFKKSKEERKQYASNTILTRTPLNTVLCDAVKLTKEIREA